MAISIKQLRKLGDSRLACVDTCREALLLNAPEFDLKADDLRAAVRLLLVCRNRREREVCGYILMHKMSAGEVGKHIELEAKRVAEIYEGLLARAGAADAAKGKLARMEALAE